MSTTVKGVGSIVTDIYTAQGSRGVTGNGDFQKIWNNQMSKGASENTASQKEVAAGNAADKVNASKDEVKQENSNVQNEKPAEKVKVSENEKPDAELTREELEEAAEKMGSIAVEMMQKIADVLGVSMEEIQAAMQALGMENADVLDASKLSGLLLNLSGATDSYALLTDEALYQKYSSLMQQLEVTLQECADELGVDAEDLLGMLKQEADAAEVENPDMSTQTVELVSEVEENAETKQSTAGEENGDGKAADNMDLKQNAFGVTQNVSGEQFQAQVQQTTNAYVTNPWDAETQNIMNQILDYMKMQVDADTTSLEMQLHPESLGTVQVNVASKGGVITANFVTENEAVKAALETQMIQLKESFAEQGVKVEAIEVTVQPHAFERNLEQGRGREQQEPDKKNRTRRINLNDSISMDIAEDMEAEDVLAAEMLMANGGTVDITV